MIHLYHRDWDRKELRQRTGTMDQIAGIRPLEAVDGPERGGRLLQVWTGSGLMFHVLLDRALDISACTYRGMSLAWQSAVGDTHPAFYEPAGDGWLRTFQGGMLVTCGLDTYGAPVKDGALELGQHGRMSNLPARRVESRAGWDGDAYCLEIRGEVRQSKVFGENLLLRRRISTCMGSNKIHITDEVTNEGFSPWPHMILYHFNTGFPLLMEHTLLRFDPAETWRADAASGQGLADWRVFQPPTPGCQEHNFVHKAKPSAEGWASAEVINPDLQLGLRLSFDTRSLPYLNEWKMMGEGLYVLGIEPMNCNHLPGRAAMRSQNSLPFLEPGETRTYTVELEVIDQY